MLAVTAPISFVLRSDPHITPDRMKKCAAPVDDLESASRKFTVPWVPTTIPELTSSIASMHLNIRRVHDDVEACIPSVANSTNA